MSTVAMVSLSEYFGFDPKSEYAELFSQIYHLTKPAAPESDIEDGEIDDEVRDVPDDTETVSEATTDSEAGDEVARDLSMTGPEASDLQRVQHFSKDILQWKQASVQNQNLWHAAAASKILPPPIPFQPHLPPPTLAPLAPSLPSLPPSIASLPPPIPALPPFSLQPTSQLNSSIFTSTPLSVAGLPPLPFPFPLGFPIPTSIPPPTSAWSNNPFLPPNLAPLPSSYPPAQASMAKVLQPLQPSSNTGNIPRDEQEFQESKGFDLKVLFDMDSGPERLTWLMNYMDFMTSQGSPVSQCPSMYKEPLDLYKLYNAVAEEGGFTKCTANKAWKTVSVKMTKNFRQSFLWRLLQKQYRKYLLAFENHVKQTNSDNMEKPLDMKLVMRQTRKM